MQVDVVCCADEDDFVDGVQRTAGGGIRGADADHMTTVRVQRRVGALPEFDGPDARFEK